MCTYLKYLIFQVSLVTHFFLQSKVSTNFKVEIRPYCNKKEHRFQGRNLTVCTAIITDRTTTNWGQISR